MTTIHLPLEPLYLIFYSAYGSKNQSSSKFFLKWKWIANLSSLRANKPLWDENLVRQIDRWGHMGGHNFCILHQESDSKNTLKQFLSLLAKTLCASYCKVTKMNCSSNWLAHAAGQLGFNLFSTINKLSNQIISNNIYVYVPMKIQWVTLTNQEKV